jgi:hypothetical protein
MKTRQVVVMGMLLCVHMPSSAENPVLVMYGFPYQGQGAALLYVEMPLGETIATLSFHSDDDCKNEGGIDPTDPICEKENFLSPLSESSA